MPQIFTIIFRKDSQSVTQSISGRDVSDLLKQAQSGGDLTVHFIYSHRGQFIPKVEAQTRNRSDEERRLWPDENDALFAKYKVLDRAAYKGDVPAVKKALDDGAPVLWPENPIGLSPLEATVRWNHEAAFDVLLNVLPRDYSPYNYASCIKLIAPKENTNILRKLLDRPLANQVPPQEMQEIFYSASCSASSPHSLEMLLNHYNVGIDYRVRDYGHTLLFAAVQERKYEIVEWLIQHGADRNATLRDGSKPIDHARDARMRALLSAPSPRVP